ncbi:MAG: RNA polymerase sigma factor [Saprospiraceae bacterium]
MPLLSSTMLPLTKSPPAQADAGSSGTTASQARYSEQSSDDSLRQGCLDQHRLAQKYLYQRYFGRLLSIPMRYTGDRSDAVEVLNQAFLKIFDSMSTYQGTGPFAGWMARIVFHCSIDHVRRQAAYRRKIKLEDAQEAPIENEIVRQLEGEDLFLLIQALPTTARTVFSLHVVDGYKHAEIATMLGIGEGTSKWHLNDARRRLKMLLAKRPNLL